nr:MAG TPA: hypothetical protein [Caudoviricetes sp.]
MWEGGSQNKDPPTASTATQKMPRRAYFPPRNRAKGKGNTMASRRKSSRPALTREAREQTMIALAMDKAEELLRGDNPPLSIVNHYLKLATVRNEVELARIKADTAEREAKTRALEANERLDEMYAKAIEAMRSYRSSD